MAYNRNFTSTFFFDGEEVSITMRRLKRKDVLKLLPYLNLDESGEVEMNLDEHLKLVEAAAEFVGDYIVSVVPDIKDDLLEEAYYMPLLGEVVGELVSHSFPTAKDQKKFEGSRGNTSAG